MTITNEHQTPCQQKGYREGDRFIVTGDTRRTRHDFATGTTVELDYDDGSTWPHFRGANSNLSGYVHLDDVEPYPATPRLEELHKALTEPTMLPATPEAETDMVNHPPHYNGHPKGIEAIDYIEDNPYPNLANAQKYLHRVSWGGKWDDTEDMKKAVWYIEREIQRRNRPEVSA